MDTAIPPAIHPAPPPPEFGRRGVAAASQGDPIDWSTPIDRDRWWVCPTLTALYHTRVYHELSRAQQRRYNHIAAVQTNEVITFFETTVTDALRAVRNEIGHGGSTLENNPKNDTDITYPAADDAALAAADAALAADLRRFIDDEAGHVELWRRLNRLSEPRWYATSDNHVMWLPAAGRRMFRALAARPRLLPFVFWFALMMEERSLEISRRCARMPADSIEPRYRRVFHDHRVDEVRHVRIDVKLIERYYATASPWVRRVNARLLHLLIGRFFFRPGRSTRRAIDLLIADHPELSVMRPRMLAELMQAPRTMGYADMMYSRRTTPLAFALMDRFPEMHSMSRVLPTYSPGQGGVSDG